MAYRLDIKEKKKGTYLIIENKYWDKEKKQSRTKHHETLGYLHDLNVYSPFLESLKFAVVSQSTTLITNCFFY